MKLDWSKAPEGTTHANPSDVLGIWRLVDGEEGWYWDSPKSTWIPLHPTVFREHYPSYVVRPVGEVK